MFNPTEIVIQAFVQHLQHMYGQIYGVLEPAYPDIIGFVARLSLENIADSDAAYHDMNHTIMVTLVGQEILRGKHVRDGGVTPRDWLHFTISLLCHDIGYVRGVCRGDRDGHYVCNEKGDLAPISAGATDASLTVSCHAIEALCPGAIRQSKLDAHRHARNRGQYRAHAFSRTGARAAYQHRRLPRPASCRGSNRPIGRHQLFSQDVRVICRISGNRRDREARISNRR
jgi:hypothetical protein